MRVDTVRRLAGSKRCASRTNGAFCGKQCENIDGEDVEPAEELRELNGPVHVQKSARDADDLTESDEDAQ